MKCASVPSAYRNCILRASVRTARNFSPARNVRSITLPSDVRRSFVRTNAPPLPGLTCWNSMILKTVPSTSTWLPFLNWFVEIKVPRRIRAGGASADRRCQHPRMHAEELRALQAPLKDRYREDPGAAAVTLRASGALGDGISCSVETGRAIAAAGLHPATGGDGSLLCSGDMLLEALVACAGVTLRAVATSLDIPVAGGTVTAEGELDFRGTLGVSKEAPVGFGAIRLRFDLDTSATDEQLETLLRLTERYCVVLQTIAGGVPVSL